MRTTRRFGSLGALRGQKLLFGVLVLLSSVQIGSAQTDFSAFWNKFRSAVASADKATMADMTKFPLSNAVWGKSDKEQGKLLAPL